MAQPTPSGGRACHVARTAGFAVPLSGTGTQTTGVVRCDQPQAIDLSARRARKLESVPVGVMDEVLARLATLMG
ncbi:type II toxin-antitoxin system PemK/MazF family toxin [Desulfovibrio sp. TomC]|uniref:type II toxin-antitoxin system PemK/MazF family toxin n=1 Tax=Desulfovibrio sp. TomC TaxID=1562888 RepID=UPI0012E2AAAD|nr:type II toxin-antitoxin system PemK/MazF family toxin [Desulfovibrio sp. TomC]